MDSKVETTALAQERVLAQESLLEPVVDRTLPITEPGCLAVMHREYNCDQVVAQLRKFLSSYVRAVFIPSCELTGYCATSDERLFYNRGVLTVRATIEKKGQTGTLMFRLSKANVGASWKLYMNELDYHPVLEISMATWDDLFASEDTWNRYFTQIADSDDHKYSTEFPSTTVTVKKMT
jgi:hypothetical protein